MMARGDRSLGLYQKMEATSAAGRAGSSGSRRPALKPPARRGNRHPHPPSARAKSGVHRGVAGRPWSSPAGEWLSDLGIRTLGSDAGRTAVTACETGRKDLGAGLRVTLLVLAVARVE